MFYSTSTLVGYLTPNPVHIYNTLPVKSIMPPSKIFIPHPKNVIFNQMS